MKKFNNPLDNIHVASPCPANWDEMLGNERKRYCADCKLNVYNLSDMTRREAERLLIESEGRLCVRFYRRADGTVLTRNCPVGWQAVKARASRLATAAFSLVAGLFGGVLTFYIFETRSRMTTIGSLPVTQPVTYVQGDMGPRIPDRPPEYKGEVTVGMRVVPVRIEPLKKARSR